MRITGRDRRVLAVGGVAAALILVYAGVAPLYDRWATAGDDIADAQRQLDEVTKAQEFAQRAEEMKEIAGRSVSSYSSWERLGEHVPRTISQIENFATYGQLSVTRLEPLPIEDHDHYAKVGLSLSFDCDLATLSQFLYDLERAQPVLAVESMQASTSRLGAGLLEVHMRVSSLAMVEEGGAG
ncbi:MAG: type II secretion system protein GspM [Armatimonadota bacterium]